MIAAVVGTLAGIVVGYFLAGGPRGAATYLPQVGTQAPTDAALTD